MHPLNVAIILAELELDKETIVAGILHDVVEDTVMTSEEIAAEFSEEVAFLVDGVTKLTQLKMTTDKIEVQAENLRKMFLSMAKDIRVILIKLADRLHNLRTLQYQSPEKQIEKARETMDIYAPIAHRLGISKIKVELDDLSMMYLMPDVYKDLKAQIDEKLTERDAYIKRVVADVKKHIDNAGLEAEIDGRVKHFFSIYKKMHLPEGMTEIPDHFAVDCFRLREVNFPHTLKHIGEKAFSLCISLKNVDLPLGMQSLGEEAFSELEALEQIVFPASMKSLGKNSCSYWKNIKRIYCAAIEPPVCDPTDGGVFSGFDFPDGLNTPVVYIPKGTINKYKDTSRNCMGWEKFWNYVEIDPSEFPTTAIDFPAIVETQSKDNSIYDLMGRKVERPQKGNIYIQNGKKFVAK